MELTEADLRRIHNALADAIGQFDGFAGQAHKIDTKDDLLATLKKIDNPKARMT